MSDIINSYKQGTQSPGNTTLYHGDIRVNPSDTVASLMIANGSVLTAFTELKEQQDFRDYLRISIAYQGKIEHFSVHSGVTVEDTLRIMEKKCGVSGGSLCLCGGMLEIKKRMRDLEVRDGESFEMILFDRIASGYHLPQF